MLQGSGWAEFKKAARDGFVQGTKEFFKPVHDPRYWLATVIIAAPMAAYSTSSPETQKAIDQSVAREIDSTRSTLSEFGKSMKRAVETGTAPRVHLRESPTLPDHRWQVR